jgi:glycosyltransferase involved in cell wall biosynthesis
LISKSRRLGLVSILNESFLADLVEVQLKTFDKIHIVAPRLRELPESVVFHPIRYRIGKSPLTQAINQISGQISISTKIIRLARQVDFWIFHGGDMLLLPMLAAKLTHSKVVLLMAGNLDNELEFRKSVFNPVLRTTRRIDISLASGIILYSKRLIKQWNLDRYESKITIADHHFVRIDTFRTTKPFIQREKMVGYVGRLSPEKGVMNLVRAIPEILSQESDVRFTFIGGGPLERDIKSYLADAHLDKNVALLNSVPHADIPKYLNEFQLCVLPSYMEGMPNVVLESMSCGTPVLTTPVGGVLDILEDKRTGFVLRDNSPGTISKAVLAALNDPDITKVALNADDYITQHYSLSAVQKRYQTATERIYSLFRIHET